MSRVYLSLRYRQTHRHRREGAETEMQRNDTKGSRRSPAELGTTLVRRIHSTVQVQMCFRQRLGATFAPTRSTPTSAKMRLSWGTPCPRVHSGPGPATHRGPHLVPCVQWQLPLFTAALATPPAVLLHAHRQRDGNASKGGRPWSPHHSDSGDTPQALPAVCPTPPAPGYLAAGTPTPQKG